MSRAESVAIVKGFRDLRRFFSAYLHDDFHTDYGTPEVALLVFKGETLDGALALASAQLRELLGAGLSELELYDALVWGLGSSFVPARGRDRGLAQEDPRNPRAASRRG